MESAARTTVRVIIFEDLQCPDCAAFQSMIETQLLPRYGSQVRFEHRNFPLAKHAWARRAAIAARFFEKTMPGLGLEFRKYALSHRSEITPDNFNGHLARFARARGTDPASALQSLADSQLSELVDQDIQEGVARGITRTPTVFVNGNTFIETIAFESVAAAIDSVLAVTPAARNSPCT